MTTLCVGTSSARIKPKKTKVTTEDVLTPQNVSPKPAEEKLTKKPTSKANTSNTNVSKSVAQNSSQKKQTKKTGKKKSDKKSTTSNYDSPYTEKKEYKKDNTYYNNNRASSKSVSTVTPYLKVDGNSSDKFKSFRADGGRETYSVSTSAATYDIWGLPDWCRVENRTSSGFTLICIKNENYSSRKDYIEVRAAGKSVRISVKQEARTSYASTSRYNSGYTNYRSTTYRKPFNRKKDDYVGGFSVGYFRKQWTYENNGKKEKLGIFDNKDYLQGVQAGLRIDPQFGWGIGMNSGVFYEFCWAKSETERDRYGVYHYTYNEHGLYVPVHLKYTMNFSEWFQLSFYGGAGLNYVFSGKVKLKDDYGTDYSEDVFDADDMKRFNVMLEYGASIRIKALQFDFTMSQGLTKWSDASDYKLKQGRPFSVAATICF